MMRSSIPKELVGSLKITGRGPPHFHSPTLSVRQEATAYQGAIDSKVNRASSL